MQQSWFELLSKQFKGYPAWAVELGIYGVIFLILGFLVKSFGKMFFLALILLAGALLALYYADFAPDFFIQLKDFVGLHDMEMLGDIPTIFMNWVRIHWIGGLAAVLGFIVGYKLG